MFLYKKQSRIKRSAILAQIIREPISSPHSPHLLTNACSDAMMSQLEAIMYITHSNSGEGLLFYGSVTIPFVDRFPKGEIYNLLTTRPEDVAHE